MNDDLLNYLEALEQGDCYRVDSVLKESPLEVTERVYLILADGTERGPYVRKRMDLDSGLGNAYERLWRAQQSGKRFMHMPRIIECGADGDQRTVLMECVEGDTLDEAVHAPNFSDQGAFAIMDELCDAVAELHQRFDPPLIHRDLKPENVIVSSTNLTLIDFGIARSFDKEAERDTRSFGTRGYAPPEQFGYGQTDERSDIYALGMLMAYCLLREEPNRALIESGFDDARIPQALRPVLARATAFDPHNRYGSVQELRVSLNEAKSLLPSPPAGTFVQSTPVAPAPLAPPPPDSAEKGKPSAGARFLRGLGAAWNVLLIAAWAILVIGSLSATFFPSPEESISSLPARGFGYLGIFGVGFGFIAYALLDKRRLSKLRLFPGRFKWYQETLICLAIGVVIVFAVAATSIPLDQLFS